MFWTSILFSPFLLSTAVCFFADFQQLHSQVELMTLFSCNGIWDICQISGYEKGRVNGVSWRRTGSWKSSKYPDPAKYFSWQEWSLKREKEEIRGLLVLLILPPATFSQWVSAVDWRFLKARWAWQHSECSAGTLLVEVLEGEATSGEARATPVKNHKCVQVPIWDAGAADWEIIQDSKSQVITGLSDTQPLT